MKHQFPPNTENHSTRPRSKENKPASRFSEPRQACVKPPNGGADVGRAPRTPS